MRTTTIYEGDQNPTVTLLPGHHSARTFNSAFQSEDKHHHANAWKDNELKFEYWIDSKNGWIKSEKSNFNAKPDVVS